MSKQINRVLSTPAVAIASGNAAFQTGATGMYYTQGGNVYGPTTATTALPLTGITVAPYSQAFLNVYVNYTGAAHAFTVEKGFEEAIVAATGSTVNASYDWNSIEDIKRTVPLWDATIAYTAGQQFVYGNTIYQVNAATTTTAGVFNSAQVTLIIDINSPLTQRALVTRILLVNNAATNFVGGTTLLTASGVSYVIFNEPEVANQVS